MREGYGGKVGVVPIPHMWEKDKKNDYNDDERPH